MRREGIGSFARYREARERRRVSDKRPFSFYVVKQEDTVDEEGAPVYRTTVKFDIEEGTPGSAYTGYADYIKIDPVMISTFMEALEDTLEKRFPTLKKNDADFPFFGWMEQEKDDEGEYIVYGFDVKKEA